LISFSLIPFLFCQVITSFFESLLFINILAFYGLYLFWMGSERLLSPPVYKKMPMLIATCITFIGVFIATNLFFTMIMDRIYIKFFS
jgi:hypothetical protein